MPPVQNERIIINAERDQLLPSSPARLRLAEAPSQMLAAEYNGVVHAPASPNVASQPSRAKNSKKTADVRWTDVMKDKLVQQVYYVKAYKRTTQTKELKFTQI